MSNDSDINKLLPRISNLVDPKVEREITASILRIYDYFNSKLQNQQASFDNELAKRDAEFIRYRNDVTSLVGVFSTPIAGSSSTDPVLQSLMNNFGPQTATFVFAGPTPSFRALVAADIPNLDTGKLTTGTLLLARLDTEILKTDDGLTEDIAGAPNVNTGKVTIKDNNGNRISVMTCV